MHCKLPPRTSRKHDTLPTPKYVHNSWATRSVHYTQACALCIKLSSRGNTKRAHSRLSAMPGTGGRSRGAAVSMQVSLSLTLSRLSRTAEHSFSSKSCGAKPFSSLSFDLQFLGRIISGLGAEHRSVVQGVRTTMRSSWLFLPCDWMPAIKLYRMLVSTLRVPMVTACHRSPAQWTSVQARCWFSHTCRKHNEQRVFHQNVNTCVRKQDCSRC